MEVVLWSVDVDGPSFHEKESVPWAARRIAESVFLSDGPVPNVEMM